MDGSEKCVDCKQSPHPRGWEPNMEKCWYCALPHPILVLTEAQRAYVQEAFRREIVA